MIITAVILFFTPLRLVSAKEQPMRVHFIDVGQADCILIQTPQQKNILIDAGDMRSGSKIVQYLKSHGVMTLDALIATHPHHDHIGSMPDIIYNFKVKAFYMPNLTNNTRSYKLLRQAIKDEKIMVFNAKAGNKIEVEPNISINIVGPLKGRYDSMNDYSYVLKLVYKKNSFLLMADAGEQSETELLSRGMNVKANIIKIGHHGADTGSTLPFLKKVNPDAAVISVGRHNPWGYPKRAVINRLKYLKVPTYRTDRLGSIVATSDGRSIHFTYEESKRTDPSSIYFDRRSIIKKVNTGK